MLSLLCKLGTMRLQHFLIQRNCILHTALIELSFLSSFDSQARESWAWKWERKHSLLLRLSSWFRDSHAWEENIFLPCYLKAQIEALWTWPGFHMWFFQLFLPGSQGYNFQKEYSLMMTFLFSVPSSEGVFSKSLFWKTQLNELFPL